MRCLIPLAIGFACACGGSTETKRPVQPVTRVLRAAQGREDARPASDPRVTVAPASASRVPFARMAKYPEPGWNVPRAVQHAPAPGGVGARTAERGLITFLASETGDETMSLFAFDAQTGKSDVLVRAGDLGETNAAMSREEELRRERQRDRNQGITSHVWAKRAKVLVLPYKGDIFVRDFAHEPSGAVRRLTKTADPEIDPSPCETGERIGFVRKGELFSIDVRTGKETALTSPKLATGEVTHGLSDYVAQEELGESSGFFWSPRCDRIAYLEVDERPVEKLPILGYRGEPDLMMQRYPRAGTKNPLVRAGIVDVATKKTVWFEWPNNSERYLGRFAWSEDGKSLFVQSMTRDQKRVALVRVDPETGKTTELAVDTSPAWVSFSPIKVLRTTSQLLVTSTKSGHRHIELRSQKDGALVRTLTSGSWDVDSIAGVDETPGGGSRGSAAGGTRDETANGAAGAGDTAERGRVFFSATKEGPLERHLYAVPLSSSNGEPTKLTTEHGVHAIKMDDGGTTWVDVHSATDRAPRAVVVRDGKPAGELPVPTDPEIQSLALRPVEHVTVKSPDGETLNGALLRPRTLTGRHPAIVMVYGGPESQLVFDQWAPRLLWQHLADRGFVVFQLDNRGTGGRGRAFAQKVHKQLGRFELEDQIAGAAWLASQPFVDGSRIGIYGHSYGGYMAALAMLEGKGAFKAGVAGSPVTDWRLYDTGYTERYMETPQTNASGYDGSDLSKKVAGLTGKLLITHALMDENVHYTNTARLVDALIAADKRFDLFVLPGERHGVRAPAAKAYMPERVAEYFADNL
jgi:dipeptidyl-peptidase 4